MGENKKRRRMKSISGSIESRVDVKNSALSYTILCWSIGNYRDLKNYALYYQTYEDSHLSCVFKLIKTKENAFVALRCGIDRRRSFFYLDNGESTPPLCISVEIASGLYVGEFSQSEISSRSGDSRRTRLLTIVFSILLDDETTYTGDYVGGLGETRDFDELCNDMGSAYLRGDSSDFVIESVGASFKVHKCILLARSEFFNEFFANRDNPGRFAVNADDGIMHLVLLYCYSGQLPHVTEDCLNSIQDVAKELGILSLVERCKEDLSNDQREGT